MKILTIVRHAKSSWDDTSLRDHERPLNKRGHRDAPEMGRRIAEHGIRPSLIVSSPAVRAWSTAKAVASALSYPYEFLEKEPASRKMIDDLKTFLDTWLPSFADSNRSYMTISIGCTGGQHRSVHMAEKVAAELRKHHDSVLTRHNNLPALRLNPD